VSWGSITAIQPGRDDGRGRVGGGIEGERPRAAVETQWRPREVTKLLDVSVQSKDERRVAQEEGMRKMLWASHVAVLIGGGDMRLTGRPCELGWDRVCLADTFRINSRTLDDPEFDFRFASRE